MKRYEKGQKIKINVTETEEDGTKSITKRTLTVVKRYPHHVLTTRKAQRTGAVIRESFTYWDLARLGA